MASISSTAAISGDSKMNEIAAKAPQAAIQSHDVVGSVSAHEPNRQDREPAAQGEERRLRTEDEAETERGARGQQHTGKFDWLDRVWSQAVGGDVSPATREPHDRERHHKAGKRTRRQVPPQRRAVLVAKGVRQVLVDPLRQVVHELEESTMTPVTRQARRPKPARAASETAWGGTEGPGPVAETSASAMGRPAWPPRRRSSRACEAGAVRKSRLRTSAAAPHSCASSANSSESSIVIRTMTVPGLASLILRAASTPPMPGIRTSSSTSSGRRRSTASTASSPDSASPTDSNPGVAAITSRAARRKTIWSSTVRTLTSVLVITLYPKQ